MDKWYVVVDNKIVCDGTLIFCGEIATHLANNGCKNICILQSR